MLGAQKPPDSVSISLNILGQLRSDILDGVYAPGQKLRFVDLQKTYPAGVGTLREALFHLASEGFVQLDAGKGFRVAAMSRDDLFDITENRVAFEQRAIRKSIQLGDDAWEVGILGAFHLLEKQERIPLVERLEHPTTWTNVHRDFHQALVAACQSNWLLHFHRILFDQAHRYRMLSLRHRPISKPSRTGEHRKLMDAVLARNVDLALSLAENHIRCTVDDVLRYVPQITRET